MREALRAQRRSLHRLRIRPGGRRPELAEIRRLAREARIPVVDDARPGGAGRDASQRAAVVLEAGPLPEVTLEALCRPGVTRILALDGVEDPQNLGALCRVADAAGVGGLLLTRRRAPPLSPAVSRASAGALEHLPVARVVNLRQSINFLKSKGFWVVGADAEAPLSLFELPDRLASGEIAVVLGGEGRGLRPGTLACLDHRVRIPMAGQVGSLNVATAGAVVLFELMRRAGLAR